MSNVPNPTPAEPTPSGPPPTPQNQYAWIWFFGFIFVASVGVTWFMIWYNYQLQLTPENLEAAKKLWQEKGAKNYNMIYTKQLNDDPKVIVYGVKVRNGKVTEVKENKEFLEKKDRDDDPRQYHSMDNLFRDAERFMNMDSKSDAKRVYVVAIFDDRDGAMRRYTRRVMGTKERVELKIELKEVDPKEP